MWCLHTDLWKSLSGFISTWLPCLCICRIHPQAHKPGIFVYAYPGMCDSFPWLDSISNLMGLNYPERAARVCPLVLPSWWLLFQQSLHRGSLVWACGANHFPPDPSLGTPRTLAYLYPESVRKHTFSHVASATNTHACRHIGCSRLVLEARRPYVTTACGNPHQRCRPNWRSPFQPTFTWLFRHVWFVRAASSLRDRSDKPQRKGPALY